MFVAQKLQSTIGMSRYAFPRTQPEPSAVSPVIGTAPDAPVSIQLFRKKASLAWFGYGRLLTVLDSTPDGCSLYDLAVCTIQSIAYVVAFSAANVFCSAPAAC